MFIRPIKIVKLSQNHFVGKYKKEITMHFDTTVKVSKIKLHTKDSKMVLDVPLPNIQHYKIGIKGK